MDSRTQCPNCGVQAVKSKAVFVRELNAQLKPKGETETLVEQECENCGWVSLPTPVLS